MEKRRIVWAIAIVVAIALSVPGFAQPIPITVPRGTSIPTSALDGVIGAEWGWMFGLTTTLTRPTPSAPSIPAVIYLKHDGRYLYIAMQATTSPAIPGLGMWIALDENDNGFVEETTNWGDDSIQAPVTGGSLAWNIDWAYVSGREDVPLGVYLLRDTDPIVGGRNDGVAAGIYNSSSGQYTFEIRYPLNSGDKAGYDAVLFQPGKPMIVKFVDANSTYDVASTAYKLTDTKGTEAI